MDPFSSLSEHFMARTRSNLPLHGLRIINSVIFLPRYCLHEMEIRCGERRSGLGRAQKQAKMKVQDTTRLTREREGGRAKHDHSRSRPQLE